jgi:signal transduction histidine kinase
LLSTPLIEKPLRTALDESIEVLKKTYEDLEIVVNYETRRAMINADQHLETLLMNLLENAVIHNNKRPRRVWVTLKEAKGGYEISIADNGPGISDEKKENLFDPKRRFGGVGIHQALRIAQKYDGYISVEDRAPNDSSQGAKFQLWLPK